MKITIAALKILLFIAIIFALFQYNIVEIPDYNYFQGNTSSIFLILFLISANIILGAYKWWLLLKTFRYNISYKICYLLYSVGVFFNSIMPGGFGGDIIKGTYLYKYIQPDFRTQSILTIIVDRVVGMHALFTICLLSGIFVSRNFIVENQVNNILNLLIIIIFLMLIILGVIIFNANNLKKLIEKKINNKSSRFKDIITKLLNALARYKEKKKSLLVCWVISIANHLLLIFCFYIMAQILNIFILNLNAITFISSSSLLANYIPITPGGIGVGEGTFNYLFISLLENNTVLDNVAFGSIFFITYRVIFTLTSILLGGISFIMLKKPNYTIKNY